MKRVSAHGRGRWVCTPKDFLDLGSREAVDQALSRLVKAGQLRRVGHGLYDMPKMSDVLKRPAPVDLNAAIAALARRDGVRIMPDGLAAANQLGLTNALPAKASYVTDGSSRTDQDRRTNGPVPPCGAECHAVGRETGGTGSTSVALAWPRGRCRRTGRFDFETPSSRRGEARPVYETADIYPVGRCRWCAVSRRIRPLPYEWDLRDLSRLSACGALGRMSKALNHFSLISC